MVGKQKFILNNSEQHCLLKLKGLKHSLAVLIMKQVLTRNACLLFIISIFQEFFHNKATKPPGIYPYWLFWSS